MARPETRPPHRGGTPRQFSKPRRGARTCSHRCERDRSGWCGSVRRQTRAESVERRANATIVYGLSSDLDPAATVGPSIPSQSRIGGDDENRDVGAGPVPSLGERDSAVTGLDRVRYQQIDGGKLGNRRKPAHALVRVDHAAVLAEVVRERVAEIAVLVNDQNRRRSLGGLPPGGRC